MKSKLPTLLSLIIISSFIIPNLVYASAGTFSLSVNFSAPSTGGDYQSGSSVTANPGDEVDFRLSTGWTSPIPTIYSESQFDVAISGTGQYQTIAGTFYVSDYIYISSDYGIHWTPEALKTEWSSVSMDDTGQYQTAVVYDGKIYVSSDHGHNWTAKDSNREWTGVAVSDTGQYQTAVVSNGKIYVSSDYGDTWIAKNSNGNWGPIAISNSGQYQAVGLSGYQNDPNRIYISSDYGNTWIPKNINDTWVDPWSFGVSSLSVSGSGQYQTLAANGEYLYVSSDYGDTWVKKAVGQLSPDVYNVGVDYWGPIAISNSGQYQTIGLRGYEGYPGGPINDPNRIYISSDYGNTWNPVTESSINPFIIGMDFISLALSNDAQYQTAFVLDEDTGGRIYNSSDRGNTWTSPDFLNDIKTVIKGDGCPTNATCTMQPTADAGFSEQIHWTMDDGMSYQPHLVVQIGADTPGGTYPITFSVQEDPVICGASCAPAQQVTVNLVVNNPSATATISADDESVSPGGNTDIHWSSINATDCSVDASGWTGLSGDQNTGSLSNPRTYTVSCNPSGPNSFDSVNVDIQPPNEKSIQVHKKGQGRVISEPAGIDCGPTCAASFDPVAVPTVTLTAYPDSNRTFVGWTGSCAGSGLTCELTTDGDKDVYANFSVTPNYQEF